MIKSESLAKFAPALLKAQKKMGAALKDAKNPFFKSKYADLNAVIDAAIPVLNEEGIAVLQAIDNLVVETVLMHESGEYVASSTPIVCAKQNDPQALGSAISYARRYGLQAMPVLKAEDDDSELAMARSASVAKVETKAASAPVAAPVVAKTEVPATEAKAKPSFNKFKPKAPVATTTVEDDI